MAFLSAEGWGLAVVIVELVALSGLIAAGVRCDPATGRLIMGLAAVGSVVIAPFALVLSTTTPATTSVAAGLVQLVPVVALSRYLPHAGFSFDALPAKAAMPRLAWPAALLAGVAVGLVASATIRFGSGATRANFHKALWQGGAGAHVQAVIGVIVIGVAVEELLFRWLLAPITRLALGRFSVLFDGALYATVFGGSASVLYCLVILAAGALASWFRVRYGRLGPIVLAHVIASGLVLIVNV